MLPIIPYLISGAASLGSAFIQNYGAKRNQDRMNSYNSPQSQMSRYGAAGLNPNLVYGQGTPGNQPSPVPYQAPSVDPIALIQKHEAIQNIKAKTSYHRVQSKALNAASFYKSLASEAGRPYLDKNAHYSSEMMKSKAANLLLSGASTHLSNLNKELDSKIKKAQALNLGLESLIKRNTINEGNYYQGTRKAYGVEKGDSYMYRGAIKAWEELQKTIDAWRR